MNGTDPKPDSPLGPREQRLITVGRLAASLAHDWNNFLTIFAAHASELSAAAPGNPAVETVAADLRESVRHASDFPQRLLTWLREEPGVRQSANPSGILHEALPLIERAIAGAAYLRSHLEQDLPAIPIDAAQFVNAVLNLASNAAQAMTAKGVIEISARLAGSWIEVSIADDGRGMTPEVLSRVGEPFFTTRSGGTGLGMMAVRGFADDHSGTLCIESAEGQGTRITIALPVSGVTSKG